MTIEPGRDHTIRDSRGKVLGVLLASKYPDQLSLERKRKAYERGQPNNARVTIRTSPPRGERT